MVLIITQTSPLFCIFAAKNPFFAIMQKRFSLKSFKNNGIAIGIEPALYMARTNKGERR